jgi:hypothetical protein
MVTRRALVTDESQPVDIVDILHATIEKFLPPLPYQVRPLVDLTRRQVLSWWTGRK